jgi:2-methylcitrate dehydratase PrpD
MMKPLGNAAGFFDCAALRMTGSGVAADEFVGRLKLQLSMKTTLAHQLASYSSSFRFEDLSEEVVHEVKRRVIDSLGCALGAWNEEPCIIARNVASDFSAKHGSTIIGTNHKAPPDWTAFANGWCIRYFDYNATYVS